mmetsp:Transcript_53373/g.167924  ORF Transcript_53373/g.167924 Transcript_53373/m.167924 type:complete len:262 (-) Transcript_53373:4-789(-)
MVLHQRRPSLSRLLHTGDRIVGLPRPDRAVLHCLPIVRAVGETVGLLDRAAREGRGVAEPPVPVKALCVETLCQLQKPCHVRGPAGRGLQLIHEVVDGPDQVVRSSARPRPELEAAIQTGLNCAEERHHGPHHPLPLIAAGLSRLVVLDQRQHRGVARPEIRVVGVRPEPPIGSLPGQNAVEVAQDNRKEPGVFQLQRQGRGAVEPVGSAFVEATSGVGLATQPRCVGHLRPEERQVRRQGTGLCARLCLQPSLGPDGTRG